MSFAATADGEGFSMPSSDTAHLGGPRGPAAWQHLLRLHRRRLSIEKRERRWRRGEWDSKRRDEIERELATVTPDVILWAVGSFGPYISQLQTDKNYLCVPSPSTWRGRQMTLVCIWVPPSPYPTCVIRNAYGSLSFFFHQMGKYPFEDEMQ